MDLSIIIVNYNTRGLTMDCIQSVYASTTRYSYEIIMIDNHSADDSVKAISEAYPNVHLIANKSNVGFAKANNQGMSMAKGRYVLLLNSDTVVMSHTLETMVAFMDRSPQVGASGCKIILPDGSLDKACKRGLPTPSASFYYAFGFSKLFPSIPRFNQYQLGYLDPNESYPVDSLVGAFMMVRREVIWQVGKLDETFFMYGEDIDWCYRIQQAGWGVYYNADTSIVHFKGGSSRRRSIKIVYEFHRAMLVFHRKHFQKKYNVFVNGAVYTGIGVKLGLSLAVNWLKRPKVVVPVSSLSPRSKDSSQEPPKAGVNM